LDGVGAGSPSLAGAFRAVRGVDRAIRRHLTDPCSTGKNWQKLDFGPFGAGIRAAKPLVFQQTTGQIP
jgi:hypothetical protein